MVLRSLRADSMANTFGDLHLKPDRNPVDHAMPPRSARVDSTAKLRRVTRWLVTSIFLLLLPLPSMGQLQDGKAATEKPQRVVVIDFEGAIYSLNEQYLYRKLEEAHKKHSPQLVIVRIDSPGGEVEATFRIAEKLRDLPWARTVAYVPRQALSGAALFSLGCDEIVLGPNAVFGDAGPIFMDQGFVFRHAPEKIRTDLARRVRDLAESTGRPPALAEAMVDMDLTVFEVRHRNNGKTSYMSQPEIDSSDNPEVWEKIKPVFETRKGHFLEVNGKRAVELGLANATVDDLDALKARYAPIENWVELRWTAVDTAVVILNHPFITFLLFVVGLIALYVELAAPGLGLGGLTALLCFSLFFWSRFLGGTAEWLEVILFGVGLILLLIELVVLPGFGIWGVTGGLLLIASLVLASEPFLVPRTDQQWVSLAQSLLMILSSGIVFLAVAAYMTRHMGQIPIFARLMLQPPTADLDHASDDIESLSASTTNWEPEGVHVGDVGMSQSPLRPAGVIQVHDRLLDVVSDGTFIEAGQMVRVVQIRGNVITVRKVES